MRSYSILLAACVALSACSNPSTDGEGGGADSTQNAVSSTGMVTTPNGVEVDITAAGDGIRLQFGQKVVCSYTGMLSDGQVFDQSAPGQPMEFVLGSGQGMARLGMKELLSFQKEQSLRSRFLRSRALERKDWVT